MRVLLRSQKLVIALIAWIVVFAVRTDRASATIIGPDAFGYTATDAVAFSFVDISGTGTQRLAGTDDTATTESMGFNFDFYGTTYNSISWSTNGLLTLGGTNANFSNVDLTTTSPSSDLPSIATLWDDWNFNALNPGSDATYFQTLGAPGSQQFVVQWNDAFRFATSPSGVTFEAILFEGSNDILFQYLDVNAGNFSSNGASSTVGIRDTGGEGNGRNLQWSFNSAVITDQQAIRFSPSPSSPPVIPEPGSFSLIGLGLIGLGWRRRHKTL